MAHKYFFRLSLDSRLQGRTIQWSPMGGAPILFFASLLKKLDHFKNKIQEPGTLKPLRILLADDDEDDRQLFEEAISRIDPNFSVETTKNGMELLERMENGYLPEIIFLDLNMPGKTGKECLAELRQHSTWKNIPIIIYSTSSNKKDILDAYTGGANLYLLKPPSFRELIGIIQKAFSFDWENTGRVEQKDFVLNYNP